MTECNAGFLGEEWEKLMSSHERKRYGNLGLDSRGKIREIAKVV
jgi:hypothetical protein